MVKFEGAVARAYLDRNFEPVAREEDAAIIREVNDDGSSGWIVVADKPGGATKAWDESQHPRGGNPKNPGEFSSAGGGTSTPTSTTRFSSREEAVDKIRALLGPRSEVKMDYTVSPHLMDAAAATYDVLDKMKAAGYAMPYEVRVMASEVDAPQGYAVAVVPGAGTPVHGSRIAILIPENLPPEISLDKAVRMAYPRSKYATRNMSDVVVHEMGHVQAGERNLETFNSEDWRAAKTVSRYAATNHDEFLAESFTRLYNGGTLTPEAQRLYDKLKGPKIL